MERASHALAADGGVWLVDPTDFPGLDERVASLGEPRAVLQLFDRHGRDCAAIAARLGVPLLDTPSRCPARRSRPCTCPAVPGWKETALWWPERRTLVVSEAVGTNRYYRRSGADGRHQPGAAAAAAADGAAPLRARAPAVLPRCWRARADGRGAGAGRAAGAPRHAPRRAWRAPGAAFVDALRRRPLHARPARPRQPGARRGGARGRARAAAVRAGRALLGVCERRSALLASALHDLDDSLRRLGAGLVVRRGEPVAETVRAAHACAAEAVFLADDVSPYARRRERRLRDDARRPALPGRHGRAAGRDRARRPRPLPRLHALPPRLGGRAVARARGSAAGSEAAGRRDTGRPAAGGGRRRRRDGGAQAARPAGCAAATTATPRCATTSPPTRPRASRSRCTSACCRRSRSATRSESGELVRQLAWRDFYAQLLAAVPGSATAICTRAAPLARRPRRARRVEGRR